MRKFKIIFWILGYVCFFNSLPGLEWKETRLSKDIVVAGAEVIYTFDFVNTKQVPMQIVSADPSCRGCMAVNWEQREYGPGERGALQVKLDTKNLADEISGTVRVRTNEEGDAGQILVIRAKLPEILRISPRTLFWDKRSEALERKVEIRTFFPDYLDVTGIEADTDWFVTKFRELEKGRYEVSVKPSSTRATRMCMIRLKTTRPIPQGLEDTIYARVR